MLCIQDIFLDTWGVMPMHTAFIPSLLCYRYRTNQDTSHSYSLSFLLMTSTVFLSWPRPQTRAHKIHSVPRLNVSESNIKSKPQEPTKDKEVKGCDDKFFLKLQMKFTCIVPLFPNQHSCFLHMEVTWIWKPWTQSQSLAFPMGSI